MLNNIDKLFNTGVANILPSVFEEIGVFKKKMIRGALKLRPPSASSIQIQMPSETITPPIQHPDVQSSMATKPIPGKKRNMISVIEDKKENNANQGSDINLAEMSKTVENSLAFLSQMDKPLKPDLNRMNFKLKSRLKLDPAPEQEHQSPKKDYPEDTSETGSSTNSRKLRFRPLPIRGVNLGTKGKAGNAEDVFLKSVFGVGSKQASTNNSLKDSVDEGSKESEGINSNPGANGTRMKFVRNILVPVNCDDKENDFYRKENRS